MSNPCTTASCKSRVEVVIEVHTSVCQRFEGLPPRHGISDGVNGVPRPIRASFLAEPCVQNGV